MTMKTIQITDNDSTCVDAGWGLDSTEVAAVPDWVQGDKACFVSRKHSSNFVRVDELRLAAFTDTNPEVAIAEALEAMKEDGVEESNQEWWQDVD